MPTTEQSHPGVSFEEQDPLLRVIQGVATAKTAIQGVFTWGPINVPTQVTSLAEARRIFGTYTLLGKAMEAITGFFTNGGKVLTIVRTVHYTDVTDPLTQIAVKATFDILDSAAVVTLQVDGKFEGARGNFSIEIKAASNGDATLFDLTVKEGGVLKETWVNLSMDDNNDRFAETIINAANSGSNLITVTDLDSVTAPPGDRPADIVVSLAGGDDGLTGIVDADFVGDAGGATGFHAFDIIPDIRILLCVEQHTAAVHQKMVDYMEIDRGGIGIAIGEIPEAQTPAQAVTYWKTTAALKNRSEFGYFATPWVTQINPLASVYGTAERITVPPSGHIAGNIARIDGTEGGVFKTATGVERGILRGIVGTETTDYDKQTNRNLVSVEGINLIWKPEGFPIIIDGDRMAKLTGSYPFINQRRGVIFIELSVQAGVIFAVHANLDSTLRAQVERTVQLFLGRQFKAGAFAGLTQAESFTVDADIEGKGINNAAVQATGTMFIDIGLAMVTPGQFIVLRISPDQRAVLEALAA